MSADISIIRMVGAYGTCKIIKAMRGSEEIGRAYFDVAVRGRGPVWFIGAGDLEAEFAVETVEVDGYLRIVDTTEDMLANVEAMLARCVTEACAEAA
jgi:hypothetical protein